jgi:hypothetical protein
MSLECGIASITAHREPPLRMVYKSLYGFREKTAILGLASRTSVHVRSSAPSSYDHSILATNKKT